MDFDFSDEIYSKYAISFDCNMMPLDFEKWTELDLKKICNNKDSKIKTNFIFGEKYLTLNNFTHIVIESFDQHFKLKCNNNFYLIEKGRKNIPIISSTIIEIMLSDKLKIYIPQSKKYPTQILDIDKKLYLETGFGEILKYNSDSNSKTNELVNLLRNYFVVLDDFNILYICNHNNFSCNKLYKSNDVKKTGISYCFFGPLSNIYKKILESEFYNTLSQLKNNKKTNSCSEIYVFDKYLQYEFIKILKYDGIL